MKKNFSLKYLTVLLFSLFLAFFFMKGIRPFLNGVKETMNEFRETHILSTDTIDFWYNDSLPAKVRLITLNGGLQRVLGKREVNNVFLLDDGQLTTVNWGADVEKYARNMIAFRDALESMDIPMLFVSAPFKLVSNDEAGHNDLFDYLGDNFWKELACFLEIERTVK